MSDDAKHGLTFIVFIGSVFSPYYARARRRGRGDPLHHCAVNVALYGACGKRWAMTERGRRDVDGRDSELAIGRSALSWDGTALTLRFDEITAPVPRRVRGVVRVYPQTLFGEVHALDSNARHLWHPIAPVSRVEADLEHPRLRWSGSGYLDSNRGTEPLEEGFVSWNWARAAPRGGINPTASPPAALRAGYSSATPGGASVLYDVKCRDGSARSLALRFPGDGTVNECQPPAALALPRTRWRMDRHIRVDGDAPVQVLETLEDSPFYARSLVAAELHGEPVIAFHESLSLVRWRTPWVQAMVPFRMPRRAR